MSDLNRSAAGPQDDATGKLNLDEVDEVLSELRQLWQRVASPVIRECLEGVRADIAYLASTGDECDDDERKRKRCGIAR